MHQDAQAPYSAALRKSAYLQRDLVKRTWCGTQARFGVVMYHRATRASSGVMRCIVRVVPLSPGTIAAARRQCDGCSVGILPCCGGSCGLCRLLVRWPPLVLMGWRSGFLSGGVLSVEGRGVSTVRFVFVEYRGCRGLGSRRRLGAWCLLEPLGCQTPSSGWLQPWAWLQVLARGGMVGSTVSLASGFLLCRVVVPFASLSSRLLTCKPSHRTTPKCAKYLSTVVWAVYLVSSSCHIPAAPPHPPSTRVRTKLA